MTLQSITESAKYSNFVTVFMEIEIEEFARALEKCLLPDMVEHFNETFQKLQNR